LGALAAWTLAEPLLLLLLLLLLYYNYHYYCCYWLCSVQQCEDNHITTL
jgi:hypothetical protein